MYLSSKQRDAFRKLYGARADEQIQKELRKRLILAGLILLATVLAAIVAGWKQSNRRELIDGYFIRRNEHDASDKTVHLIAESEGLKHKMNLSVASRTYSDEEIQKMLPEFWEKLNAVIIPKGQQADHITEDLKLVESLPEYPFRIRWQSDKPLLVKTTGRIDAEELRKQKAGVMVILTAEVRYEDYEEERLYTVRIYPKSVGREQSFWNQTEEAVSAQNEKTQYEYLKLPEVVDNHILKYQEVKSSSVAGLILCGCVLAMLVYIKDDEKLLKRAAQRDEELNREYPQLVSRLTLYLRAGLTLKNAWHRICRDYGIRKKSSGPCAVYEQMMKSDEKMKSGMSEVEAYREFAEIIGLTSYKSLISLLVQSLETGNSQIQGQLERLVSEAFMERKREARSLGEKAGTKLLGPMFVMLIVVLVMILIPAAMSFAM